MSIARTAASLAERRGVLSAAIVVAGAALLPGGAVAAALDRAVPCQENRWPTGMLWSTGEQTEQVYIRFQQIYFTPIMGEEYKPR